MLFPGENGAQDTYEGLLQRAVKKFAEKAYRTILVAYRDLSMR
jgi:magnesium-transporting ATPase (P-type)